LVSVVRTIAQKTTNTNIGMIGDGNASSTGDDNEDSGDPVKIEETSESGFDVDDLPRILWSKVRRATTLILVSTCKQYY
jgi:hypothetical protein